MVELTRDAVDQAITEFDTIGRRAFLAKYGFGGARNYFLTINGKNYDSKAIVAVAYKYLANGKALLNDELSGGLSDAAFKLEKLGYQINTPGENADWTWDEHVLALQLYMQFPKSPPNKTSKEIINLSAVLNRLGERRGVARTAKFRNANGVYMKLMNFRRFDPQFAGRSGLARGSTLEKRVWDRYFGNTQQLDDDAATIYIAIDDPNVVLTNLGVDEDFEADESAVKLRVHYARERSPELIRKKREQVLSKMGRLACEVCDFDFSQRYGEHGDGFIEVHHLKPVSSLEKGQKTRVSELAVVCSNCHRMLHRRGLIDMDSLRGKLQARPMDVKTV